MGAQMTGGTATPPAVAPARLGLCVLSDADLRRVHAAALELLGDAGAAAEAAAAGAPATFILAGRTPERCVVLGGGGCLLATGGPAPRLRPLAGGDPLPATAADLAGFVRLADALPEVAIVAGPPVRAAGETALGELALCFAESSKHVQLTTLRTVSEAETAVRMALAVAGSEAALRARPPLSLCGGPEARPAAEVFARSGLPVGFVLPPAVPDASGTAVPAQAGPATVAAPPPLSAVPQAPGATGASSGQGAPDVAAALVRQHAGVLAACAAVQAAAPGAPFFYLAQPALAGLPACGPQAVLFQVACVPLAGLVGLPVMASAMATGSHEPDWQACTQDALGSLAAAAAAADVVAGAGTLGAGGAFSAQQLVMDAEVFSWNASIAAGISVGDEEIAADVIAAVGVGGNYLGQRHTRRHMKDVWRPRLLDRSMWDAWVASGREGAYERATALARELVETHQAAPLAPATGEALAGIVAASAAPGAVQS
jgi:trimethylamine---corrinoid protein Co-methyltransferase